MRIPFPKEVFDKLDKKTQDNLIKLFKEFQGTYTTTRIGYVENHFSQGYGRRVEETELVILNDREDFLQISDTVDFVRNARSASIENDRLRNENEKLKKLKESIKTIKGMFDE